MICFQSKDIRCSSGILFKCIGGALAVFGFNENFSVWIPVAPNLDLSHFPRTLHKDEPVSDT